MSHLRLMALALVLLAMVAATPDLARAQQPTFEVTPARSHCVAPFEARARGLAPNQSVEVEISVDGAVTGSVAGTSDQFGQFFSPIPMILLPCSEGGLVAASISVGGEPLPQTAHFEVAEPVVPPPSPTATATAGLAAGTPRPPDVGSGPGESVASSAQASSLWVLVTIAVLATAGMTATWVTRPRT
jgi:hypothetical protein